jgi:hypothetical protein
MEIGYLYQKGVLVVNGPRRIPYLQEFTYGLEVLEVIPRVR